ncbi:hypothetical protein STEG23_005886 [Scotinomys teguina]
MPTYYGNALERSSNFSVVKVPHRNLVLLTDKVIFPVQHPVLFVSIVEHMQSTVLCGSKLQVPSGSRQRSKLHKLSVPHSDAVGHNRATAICDCDTS